MIIICNWTEAKSFVPENYISYWSIFLLWEFLISCCPREYGFIDLVWKKCYDKIRLGEFFKDQKFPEKKKCKYQQVTRQLQIIKSLRMRYCWKWHKNRVFHRDPFYFTQQGS